MTTYKIDYCCNDCFLTIDAEDLKEATQKAMESAVYTQRDIKIRDERYNTLMVSRWYDVPPEDWDKPILIICGGFYDGFQDIEYSEYI